MGRHTKPGAGRPRSVDGRKTSIYLRRRAEQAWAATVIATGKGKPDVLEAALVDYARKNGVPVAETEALCEASPQVLEASLEPAST